MFDQNVFSVLKCESTKICNEYIHISKSKNDKYKYSLVEHATPRRALRNAIRRSDLKKREEKERKRE